MDHRIGAAIGHKLVNGSLVRNIQLGGTDPPVFHPTLRKDTAYVLPQLSRRAGH